MNITYIVSTDWDHFWPPIHNVQGLKLFSAMATRIFWSLWVLWWIYYIVSVFKYVFSVQQSIGRRRILKELLHTAPEKRSEKVLDMCYLHADEKDFPTDELFEHLDKKFKRMEKEGFIESNGEINDIPVGGGNGDEDDALPHVRQTAVGGGSETHRKERAGESGGPERAITG
ncbi:hypothetical protein BKA65DRAFT_476928 [Rhexocercosporidium sp. MPI-PUGE-AT-0058]|nr:hypothetical protein BKA65DRAFT_476928 [Rhexocercosporidium sp. MPI-PUGE-AT-0058]